MRWLVALAAASAFVAARAIEPPQGAAGAAKQAEADPQAAAADEPPAEEPATPKPAGDAAKPADAPAGEADGEEDEELPPLPPGTVPAGPPPQRFNPTEKVRADFPVSFPIDI